ncbi:MAG TPA: hypothetical protein VLD62_04735, partial [Acidimicrobiia bacterium]|nr:hypothetical protein [Acidimicrobiia bacterium]
MRRWITAMLTAALVLWGAVPAMAMRGGPPEYDVAFFLAAEFDEVEVDTVRNLHDEGLGFGAIFRLTIVALLTGHSLDDIVDAATDDDGKPSDELGDLLSGIDPALLDGLPENLGRIIANAHRKAHGLDPLPAEPPKKPAPPPPPPPTEKPDDQKADDHEESKDDGEHDESKDDGYHDDSKDESKDDGSGGMTGEEFEQRYKELEARKAEAYEVYKQCIKESETTLYAGKDAVYAEIERLTIEKQQKVEAVYAQLKEATTDEE